MEGKGDDGGAGDEIGLGIDFVGGTVASGEDELNALGIATAEVLHGDGFDMQRKRGDGDGDDAGGGVKCGNVATKVVGRRFGGFAIRITKDSTFDVVARAMAGAAHEVGIDDETCYGAASVGANGVERDEAGGANAVDGHGGDVVDESQLDGAACGR